MLISLALTSLSDYGTTTSVGLEKKQLDLVVLTPLKVIIRIFLRANTTRDSTLRLMILLRRSLIL
ncbi:hypothetical protein C487_19763 [Natrinema pallidum DSM 3751]|uniref:Uncharacterized protein n=1 Tax=Natrinema pallidum DSM 3751 TaxID=1227495 RepID=L9YE16_9EURY|nr:hypothetical protein C487_19763 [Natrinema pallidum DSM 3751]